MVKTVKQIDGFEIETIDYTQDEEPDTEQELIDYWIEVYGYDKFNREQKLAFHTQIVQLTKYTETVVCSALAGDITWLQTKR